MILDENEWRTEGAQILTLPQSTGGEQMQHHIIIKECSTSEETSWFWQQLAAYFHRDIFPGEGMPDFEDYRHRMQSLHDRRENPI